MIPVEKSMLRKNRKSINTKKVTTKSVVGTNKYANHSTEPITWEAELQMMLQEEILQTKVDNFWGLDKDHDDRQRERLLMGKEEQESMFQELVHKTLRQQLQWDIELQQEKKEQEEFLIYKKLSGMQLYLDMLYNSTSSDDFVNFVWSSESSMNINNSSTSVGPNSIAIQTIGHSYADNVGHSSNTMYDLFQNSLQESELTFNTRNSNKKSNTVSFQQGNSNEYDRSNTFGNSFGNSKKGTKMNTLANVHNMEVSDDIIKDRTLITPLQTSVHLDGLQKSRAIISEASFSFQKTLKRLNSTSVTDMAMSTFKAKDPTKSLRKNFEEQNQSMKQKCKLTFLVTAL